MVRETKTVGSNEVFLDINGVLRAVYRGWQTADKLERTIMRIMKLTDILISNDRPIRILADIRKMGQYDQAARIVGLHSRTIVPFWKMAFVTTGLFPEVEKISRNLTLMSGRKQEIRYFQREDDAVGWLGFMK